MLGTIVVVSISSIIFIKLIRLFLENYWWGSIDLNNEESVYNKIVIITGANTGIGKATAAALSSRGAHVVLACRNLEATKEAILDIRKSTHNGTLIPMKLDLSSLDSVRNFVIEFKSKYKSLNILINNAGVYYPMSKRMKTKDGNELHFGVNHLGHFLLTNLLLDTIKSSAPSRIITISSLMHCFGKINWSDIMYEKEDPGLETFVSHPLYANSKLANALFSKELAKRLKGTSVNTYCLCPGLVATDMTRNMDVPFYFLIFKPLVSLLRKNPEQGALTTLYCALSKEVKHQSGEMYQHCGYWDQKSRIILKDEDAERLWEISLKLTGFPSIVDKVESK